MDVIVIGAGMAGLSAARVLAEAGQRVLVLEATDRAGGRIRTVRQEGVPIELGAEFVHGKPPELWALIEEAGLATYERTGATMSAKAGGLAALDWEDGDDPLDGLKTFTGPDCTFLEYVDRLGLAADERAQALGYVEGYNAADARQASVLALARQQVAEEEIEGDRLWRFVDGYDRLPEFLRDRVLAAGGEIRLNSPVDMVEWERSRVRVRVAGQEFAAVRCVVTVPLGVLQAGAVRFLPEPADVLRAASRMRMGPVFRMSLLFRERLWPEEMSFLLARETMPPVWWTSHPDRIPLLTAWAGGPQAASLLALGPEAQTQAVCASLAVALGLGSETVREALVGAHMFDWQIHPYTKGSYSWVPVGGLEASRQMAKPVERTLFFAGEHTDLTGHWGTVHAALGSGVRAAKQVLDASLGV